MRRSSMANVSDMDRERQAIAEAASKITDLWWANPEQNGHLKTQAVIEILQKQFWGFTDAQCKKAAQQ